MHFIVIFILHLSYFAFKRPWIVKIFLFFANIRIGASQYMGTSMVANESCATSIAVISLKCVLTRTNASASLRIRTYQYQHTQERFTYMYYLQVCRKWSDRKVERIQSPNSHIEVRIPLHLKSVWFVHLCDAVDRATTDNNKFLQTNGRKTNTDKRIGT